MKEGRLRGDLITVCNFHREGSGAGGADLSLVTSNRTQANRMKLCPSRFRLDIRKSFSTKEVANHWNSLPREVVMHQASQSSRIVWRVLLVILLNFI